MSAGGAIDVNSTEKQKGPLVIKKQANRDWRDEGRQKKHQRHLPASQARGDGAANKDTDAINGGSMAYGLTVAQPGKAQDTNMNGDPQANGSAAGDANPPPAPAPKTDDERALAALLGDEPKSSLVLPAAAPANEDDAFRRDYREAPDMSTLEEYAAVPVEEFGAALLRGMGWKDGEPIGKRRGQQAAEKPREVVRRAALLGIGAKEDAAVAGELGAWGKGAKTGARRKVEQSYNPVLLRNTRTGEQLTEEELKIKEEREKMLEAERKRGGAEKVEDRERSHRDEEKKERRKRYDDYDSRDPRERHDDYDSRDRRDRGKDRDKDREKRRDGRDDHREGDRSKKSSRRERSSSAESYRRRRRNDEDRRRDRPEKDSDRSRRDRDDNNDKGHYRRDRRERDDRRDRDRRRRD